VRTTHLRQPLFKFLQSNGYSFRMNTVYGNKSFLSTESDTKILQSIYFTYKVGIISSYSNRSFRMI